jgi:hypothetical protein
MLQQIFHYNKSVNLYPYQVSRDSWLNFFQEDGGGVVFFFFEKKRNFALGVAQLEYPRWTVWMIFVVYANSNNQTEMNWISKWIWWYLFD